MVCSLRVVACTVAFALAVTVASTLRAWAIGASVGMVDWGVGLGVTCCCRLLQAAAASRMAMRQVMRAAFFMGFPLRGG